MRMFAVALAAVQVVQGLTRRESLPGFNFSYWVVSYQHGFVRRGLGGEILRLLTGAPSVGAIDVVFALVVVVSVLALLAVVELLLRTERDGCAALAILLAASPFGFDYLTWEHRPDQLGVPLLVVLGIGVSLGSPHTRRWVVAGSGLAFGALTLVHEGAALIVLPWALVVVAVVPALTSATSATAKTDRPWREVGLLVGPAGCAFAAVVAFGRASPGVVAQFQRDSPKFVGTANGFIALGHSFGEAWTTVENVPSGLLVGAVVTGAVLTALQLAWVRGWAGTRLLSAILLVRPRLLGAVAVVGIAVTTALLFVTGVDWLRWFAAVGCSWLVASAFVTMSAVDARDTTGTRTTSPTRRSTVALPNLLPVAAVLLVLLEPLPEGIRLSDLHRLVPLWG
ncbi:MAG: hypothetical protein ACHQIG_00855 [Acidimicrobiia bacterium]